jgi:hypothetical protein
MEGFLSRFANRFIVVDLIPGLVAVMAIWLVFASGAPSKRPDLNTLGNSISGIGLIHILLGLGLAVAVGVLLHPLQHAMVQLLEGYWAGLPFGAALFTAGKRRYLLLVKSLEGILDADDTVMPAMWKDRARLRRRWIPTLRARILPTALGNALRAGEDRAGSRYGLDAITIMPVLQTHLSAGHASQISDQRNQLDAAVRFTFVWLALCLLTVPMLIRHDVWLSISVVLYVLGWVAYRAAVVAACELMTSIAAAIDEHRWDLYEALHLRPPTNLAAERGLGPIVTKLLHDGKLNRDAINVLVYEHPQTTDVRITQ